MIYATWTFEDCKVREADYDNDLHCFEVEMWDDDGETRVQVIVPKDIEEMHIDRMALDSGSSPMDGWEDGNGNLVCWENADTE